MMTTLMLNELTEDQLDTLDALDRSIPIRSTSKERVNPWEPKRKPSQPAIRPWWQHHVPREDSDRGEGPDLLWGRGSGAA